MPFPRLTLAALMATLPLVAAAEDTHLPRTVVTDQADLVPDAATRSGKALRETTPATDDTASLLRDMPGVSLYKAGGVSSLPAIRGLADDRLRIRVDGMDLIASCPNHMNPALSYIEPAAVAHASVFAGITPVSVGGDSIGGSIVVDSAAPRFAAPGEGMRVSGEAGARYGSNGDAFSANLSAAAASEQFSAHYTGSTARSNDLSAGGNFKRSTATGRVGHTLDRDTIGSTAYQTSNHQLNLAYRQQNHLFEARFGLQDMAEQLYPNQRMDLLDNSAQRTNLRYEGRFDRGRFEARAYHEEVDHFMDFGDDKRYWYSTASGGSAAINGVPCAPIAANCAAGMPMYTSSQTDGLRLQADITLNDTDLVRTGVEYQAYELDDWWPASGGGMWPGTFWNIRDGERDRWAVFGEWEGKLAQPWTALFGLRYERVASDAGDAIGYNPAGGGFQGRDADAFNAQDHQRTDNNWDVTALARYALSTTAELEFGFARKTRSPNLYERYTWSTWQMAALMNNFVGDGNGYVGNLDLEPEKAHTLSATLNWHAEDNAWGLKVTPFYTRVSDYIDAVQWNGTTNTERDVLLEDQFTVLRYTNQTARLFGIDLTGHLPLAHTAYGAFGLKGVLSYVDGKNLDTGDDLYNIMPINTRLTLTHQFGGWNNAAEVVAVGGKHDVSDQRNEIETSGYTLLNLRASYAWQQVQVDFGVENVFDRLYFDPLGGAYLGQGTTMSATAAGAPAWGLGVPGAGRNLYAGVKLRF